MHVQLLSVQYMQCRYFVYYLNVFTFVLCPLTPSHSLCAQTSVKHIRLCPLPKCFHFKRKAAKIVIFLITPWKKKSNAFICFNFVESRTRPVS